MIIEYIWLDFKGNTRSKIRVIHFKTTPTLENIPKWSYDGSSTGQRETRNSEVILIPIKMWYKNEKHIYVICKGEDNNNNSVLGYWQTYAENQFKKIPNKKPWFGVEQEFFILDKHGKCLTHESKGNHYCGVGHSHPIERKIMDDFLHEVIHLGIHISGINQEVAPGQWEYQIGPVEGIDAAHELFICKYLINKIAEGYGCCICFDAKLSEKQNGSGCHVNISTVDTRENVDAIFVITEKMKDDHLKFIDHYCGNNVEKRLTGTHETSDAKYFSIGVANRAASVRIPQQVWKDKKGYFEDRRPCSDIDYYKTLGKYCDYL